MIERLDDGVRQKKHAALAEVDTRTRQHGIVALRGVVVLYRQRPH